jgi:putative MATE family efflux protein
LLYNDIGDFAARMEIYMEILEDNPSSKKIRKKIYKLILPITIDNILQMIAGLVSMGMIGRVSTLSVGAIGLSTRITQIIWALFKGITTGATVFVAQAYGAKDYKRLRHVIQQAMLSIIIFVVILQQVIFWNASALLRIFNPAPDLLANATLYLKTVSFGLPFWVIMIVVSGVLQGMGNANTPMKITGIMNLLNVLLGYALIFGNFGIPKLGIFGAAMGLVIAQVIGALLGLYVLFNKEGVLGPIFNRKFFHFDLKEIFRIYKVGTPTAFESIFWQLSAIILTRVILSYGVVALASYQIGLNAESISFTPALGFSVAATALVGQALGEKDGEMGRKYLRELIKGSAVLTILLSALLIFLPKQIMGLLTNDKNVIELGAKYLFLMGLVQLPQNISGVLNGALRGAGYTWVPMVVAFTGIWLIRVPLSLILNYVFHFDIIAIYVVICIDQIIRFGLSISIYKIKNIYKAKLIIEKS